MFKVCGCVGNRQSKSHRAHSAALERNIQNHTRVAKELVIHHNPDAEHEKREKERDELLKSRELLEARQVTNDECFSRQLIVAGSTE